MIPASPSEYVLNDMTWPEDWPTYDCAETAANHVGCNAAGADLTDLMDDNGNYTVFDDVWVDYHGSVTVDGVAQWGTVKRGPLTTGFGANGVTHIGPELGFGVELAKTYGGNRPLVVSLPLTYPCFLRRFSPTAPRPPPISFLLHSCSFCSPSGVGGTLGVGEPPYAVSLSPTWPW